MKDNNKNKPILPVGTKILFTINNKTYVKKEHGDPFSKWKSAGGGTIIIDDERIMKKELYKVITDNEVNEETMKELNVLEEKENKSQNAGSRYEDIGKSINQ